MRSLYAGQRHGDRHDELKAGIELAPGVNNLTVTATDNNGVTATDTITVTYAPTFPGDTMAGALGV